MTHISLIEVLNGKAVDWLEIVGNEEYQHAADSADEPSGGECHELNTGAVADQPVAERSQAT